MRSRRRQSIAAQQGWADGYQNRWVPVRWYASRNPRRTRAALSGCVGVVHTARFVQSLNA